MGKGNGSTRTSSATAPNGLSGSSGVTGTGDLRIRRTDSIDKTNRLHEAFGNGFAVPVYEFEARNYYNATGKELPDDAVKVVLGRGAANGDTFERTLATPEYSNIKVIEADIRPYPGGRGEPTTFITGYNDLEQLRSFVKDVQTGGAIDRYNRVQRSWRRR